MEFRDEANHLLFVGCPKKPMVVVFDAKTGKEVSAIEIPGGIDDMHFDAVRNRIYASCGDNVLAVLGKKGDSYEIIAKIESPKFSRTCVYADGMLYLAVPRGAGREGPEIRIFAAK